MSSIASTEDQAVEAPQVETEAPATTAPAERATPEQAAEPKTRREHIEAAMSRHGGAEPGKQSAAPEPPPSRKYPGSWRKEAETAYRKAEKLASQDVELKALLDEIDKRESDYFSGVSRYKQQAEYGTAFAQALEPYMQTIKQLGVAPHVAVQSLLEADRKLRHGSPDEKRIYLSQLAGMYGIEQHAEQGSEAQQDPLYSQLRNEITQLKQHLAQSEQRKAQESAGLVADEINTFAQGKEHFDAVREDMAALLQSGRANTLEDAYERALWANPETRASLMTQQRQAEEAKREQERKEAAAKARSKGVQVRGSSPAGSGLNHNPKDLRATIAAAMEHMQ